MEQTLQRSYSSCRSTSKIIPSNSADNISNSQIQKYSTQAQEPINKPKPLGALLRSLLSLQALLQTCRIFTMPSGILRPSPRLGRIVTGTLFGYKKGHVSFAIQTDPRSEPLFLIELATTTSKLVKEMSSGLVRIALECKSGSNAARPSALPLKLFQEPMWSMYCNGKKCGYAVARMCSEHDWQVLSTVQTVSTGAGVIPMGKRSEKNGSREGGDVMYMRGKFERVVGNRDSEAFYMMNPDGAGGPELSMFLLRI